MVRIAPLIGLATDTAMTWAVRGLDHVLRDGRSPAGGIADVPPAAAATRPWWVQNEAIQLLLIVAAHVADNEPYVRAYDDLSGFVDQEFLDPSVGGWYPIPRGEWGLGARLVPARLPKAHRWKDASHETDAYLNGIRILRGVPDSAALE